MPGEEPREISFMPYAVGLGLALGLALAHAEGRARRREDELLHAVAIRDRSLRYAGEETLRLQRALVDGLPGLEAGLRDAVEDAVEQAEVEAEEIAHELAGVDPSA